MLDHTPGVNTTSSLSLHSFLEGIGIGPITSRVGWGIVLLAVLAGNVALAIVAIAIVRWLVG
jgi:hypothetical protein